jgi:hypothetical protein
MPGMSRAAVPGREEPELLAAPVLIVIFFIWAGQALGHGFKLPSSSKLLLILAAVAALVGVVLATRQGRRFAVVKLLPGLRSAYASLAAVAVSPVKLAMLFGGSALVTWPPGQRCRLSSSTGWPRTGCPWCQAGPACGFSSAATICEPGALLRLAGMPA